MKKNFLYIIFILFLQVLSAQESESIENSNPKESKDIYALDDIPAASERIGVRILDLQKTLSPSNEIIRIDSVLKITLKEVSKKKDSLFLVLGNQDSRDLSAIKVEWKGYKTKLKSSQDVLNARSTEVSGVNDELVAEINKLEETKKTLAQQSPDSDNIYKSLDDVIGTLRDVVKVAHIRLDSIFIIQKNVTEIVLSIDEVLSEIENYERLKQKNYFVFDYRPIWEPKPIDSLAEDKKNEKLTQKANDTLTVVSAQMQYYQKRSEQNKKQLQNFISYNAKSFAFQIITIFFILSMLIFFNRRMKGIAITDDIHLDKDAHTILSNPLSSSLIIGILISVFYYEALLPLVSEIFLLLVTLGTLNILPKLTTKRLFLFLGVLLSLFIVLIFESYILDQDTYRNLVLFESILLTTTFFVGRRSIKSLANRIVRLGKILKWIIPFFTFLSILSVIANVIGMLSFSAFLVRAVLSSVIIGAVVITAVKVAISITLVLFKFRKKTYNLQTIAVVVDAANKRMIPILYWVGFIIWIYFSLKAFNLYHLLLDKFESIITLEYLVGDVTISIGGILAFTMIFVVTLFFAKLVSTIFQDDWLIKVLPRGIAPAISLMLRIILITIGLYAALSAAGLDLTKLSFIVGALGVGIGFGLQNVVLNFIAGLILAFERPINLGDTIEVDNEFGVVTSIGVRSSNIKTYSGAETIIPNGDLVSKKVINWTLSSRDRRTKLYMQTAPNADPRMVLNLFKSIAESHPFTLSDPEPSTYFKGYSEDGNLKFELWYWTTFSETLTADNEIALTIFEELKRLGIDSPVPNRRVVSDK